jgi:hypothetical protein
MLSVPARPGPASVDAAPPPLPAEEPRLDAAGLIAAWEAATTEVPLRRAAILLGAAWPGQDWLLAPIGQRDRFLFRLRERLFGPAMEASADCPACGATLDLPLTTQDLLVDAAPPPPEGYAVEAAGYRIRCRLPDSRDLLAVAEAPPTQRADLLLDRCVLNASHGDRACDPASLPRPVRDAIAVAMEAADPQADPQLGLNCPECGHGWTAPFDIAAFLWDDIEDCVARLLRQVHILAGAYGWTEATILGLTARRRRWYVEAVTGAA